MLQTKQTAKASAFIEVPTLADDQVHIHVHLISKTQLLHTLLPPFEGTIMHLVFIQC